MNYKATENKRGSLQQNLSNSSLPADEFELNEEEDNTETLIPGQVPVDSQSFEDEADNSNAPAEQAEWRDATPDPEEESEFQHFAEGEHQVHVHESNSTQGQQPLLLESADDGSTVTEHDESRSELNENAPEPSADSETVNEDQSQRHSLRVESLSSCDEEKKHPNQIPKDLTGTHENDEVGLDVFSNTEEGLDLNSPKPPGDDYSESGVGVEAQSLNGDGVESGSESIPQDQDGDLPEAAHGEDIGRDLYEDLDEPLNL